MRIQERNNFRNSKEWHEFRDFMYRLYDGKDPVTGKKLEENWNLHHLLLNHDKYNDISDQSHFVPLNKSTHELVHKLYNESITVTENVKLTEILRKMEQLNSDNIESILFRNHIDYSFDEKNKVYTCRTATELGLATSKWGMILWRPDTPGSDKNQPIDTKSWVRYQYEKNNWDSERAVIALELRHLCLYSSLKNMIRPEVKVKWDDPYKWETTKNELIRELINTTKIINKWRKRHDDNSK